jgi:hypothetical protein
MLIATPTQIVCTSGFMYCIVSYTTRPAYTEPPGELMYMLTSFSGSSDSRWISWATTRFAMSSVIGVPRKMFRSLSRRE